MSESLSDGLVNLKKIRGAWMLPRPDWDVINAWIRGHVPEADWPRAWGEAVEQWLDRLNRALGGKYRLITSRELWLFTAQRDEEVIDNLLTISRTALEEVRKVFGGLATTGWRGPLPLLHFADQETYYDYLSQFHEEGEYGGSAGCCVQRGYVHVALAPAHDYPFHGPVAHELTHACLFHLELPAWLEEGATQHMEDIIYPEGRAFPPHEALVEMRDFWKREGLSGFWWGQGYLRPDEGQSHSYNLSRILFHLLLTDHPAQYREFMGQAKADDAGESAARSALGCCLVDLAARFLGPGEWEPIPPDATAFCSRAAFRLKAGCLDGAQADIEAALRLSPSLALAHAQFGELCLSQGASGQAVSAYEKAVQLEPRNRDACNMLAWLLATCPDTAVRNGARAIELATRACEMTGYATAAELDTLAAAHAEVGDFEEAVRWQKETLRVAAAEEREEYSSRLKLYRKGQPFRAEKAGGHRGEKP